MKLNNTYNQKGGYSIIAAVLMVGFLLVLTTSTLNLVLQEMQDGKGRQDYMKAYARAEWALELALLKMKQNGYWYDSDNISNPEILGVWNKIPKLGYEFESKVTIHTGSITPYESDIIPLFWINESGNHERADNITLFTNPDMVWNIVTESWGISWKGSFSPSSNVWEKTYKESTWEFKYDPSTTISSVLSSSGESYLTLYNPLSIEQNYTLSWDEFTLPRATISSSAQVWKYTQNLETLVDNTKFLGILKYSIYSWN